MMAFNIQENEAERGQGHFRGFGFSHSNGHSQYCLHDVEAHRFGNLYIILTVDMYNT